MSTTLKQAVVRILKNSESLGSAANCEPVGTGFLISAQHVLTCAHVVKIALGIKDDEPLDKSSDKPLYLDFPHLSSTPPLEAKLMVWKEKRGDYEGDVALLEITENVPDCLKPVRLIDIDDEYLRDHSCYTFGFTNNFKGGFEVSGKLKGSVGERLKIEREASDQFFVERGFSGAPVWDQELQSVIGMVSSVTALVGSETDRRVGFVVPVRELATVEPSIIHDAMFDALKANWRPHLEEMKAYYSSQQWERFYPPVTTELDDLWKYFIGAPAWHEKVKRTRDLLINELENVLRQQVLPEFSSFLKEIKYINTDINYVSLYSKLCQLRNQESGIRRIVNSEVKRLEKLTDTNCGKVLPLERWQLTEGQLLLKAMCNLRTDFIDLEHKINSPYFERSFLIAGGMGAGKTHFMMSLLENCLSHNPDNPPDIVVLQLKLPDTPLQLQLKDLILASVQDCSDVRWPDLRSFDQFLRSCDRVPPLDRSYVRVGKSHGPIHRRLVIMIDDLHLWVRRDPDFVNKLRGFIQEHTEWHSLYWIITMPEHFYEHLTDRANRDFWPRYSLDPNPSRQSRGANSSIEAPPMIDGWLVLDDLNIISETGLKIIRQQLDPDDSELAVDFLEKDQRARRALSNPFVSKECFSLLKNKIPVQEVANLIFIDFIAQFGKDQVALAIEAGDDIKANDLHELVQAIAEFLNTCGELLVTKTDLVNNITTWVRGDYRIKDPNYTERAIEVMGRSLLLKVTRPLDIPIYVISQDHVEICFEPFWEYVLAQRALERQEITSENLEHWFSELKAAALKEGALESVLLLLDVKDQNQLAGRALASDLAAFVLDHPSFPHSAVWFAGAKASLHFQKVLMEKARRIGEYSLNRHTLFAFLCFMGSADPDVAEMATRISIIKPLFRHIAHESYARYFLHIFKRWLSRVQDPMEIINAMPVLTGCEELGIEAELAEFTVRTLFELVNEDIDQLMKLILTYLDKVARQHIEYVEKRFIHRLYHEWVMFSFLEALTWQRSKINEVHAFLDRYQWYNHALAKDNGHLRLQMEREANIALGILYHRVQRDEDERDQYIQFIDELVQSHIPKDRQKAFHIIRHTQVLQKDDHEENVHVGIVDDIFNPRLKVLFFDKSLQSTIENPIFHRLFEINLEDFSLLEAKRQSQRRPGGHHARQRRHGRGRHRS